MSRISWPITKHVIVYQINQHPVSYKSITGKIIRMLHTVKTIASLCDDRLLNIEVLTCVVVT